MGVAVGLFGCGGGGGGGAINNVLPASTGYLIDAPVQGVAYTCGKQNGITGSDGAFLFEAGSGCSFSSGKVTIGTVSSVPTDSKITPYELAGAVRTDSQNVAASAIAQLLQTLDNGNTSGVITISPAISTAL